MSDDSFTLIAFSLAERMQVTEILLALGSNYQADEHLSFAIHHLQSFGRLHLSGLLVNPDYTATPDNPKLDYSNQCAIIQCYQPQQLSQFIEITKRLELQCHRDRKDKRVRKDKSDSSDTLVDEHSQQRLVSLDIDVLAIKTAELDTDMISTMVSTHGSGGDSEAMDRVDRMDRWRADKWQAIDRRYPFKAHEWAGIRELMAIQ